MLHIREGRNFSLRPGSSSSPPNLLASCRFLSADEVVQSQVCWGTTRPVFALRHQVHVSLDGGEFVERCRDNYLVIEVWRVVGQERKVLGIAMAPLHQFYMAFKVSRNFLFTSPRLNSFQLFPGSSSDPAVHVL